MSSIHFIGGEKGGVGKSVAARALAQYCIDKGLPFTGFDTDRSHASFSRFYGEYAHPVIIDRYESLDLIATHFESHSEQSKAPCAIVDLAAQTAAPLARWIHESDVLSVLQALGVSVHFWHVCDGGQDSVALLEKLTATYGEAANFVVVKNLGRGSDFKLLESSKAYQHSVAHGAVVLTLPALHEASMHKIDKQNASFWAAIHRRDGVDSLGMLERQRVKMWLKHTYDAFDSVALA